MLLPTSLLAKNCKSKSTSKFACSTGCGDGGAFGFGGGVALLALTGGLGCRFLVLLMETAGTVFGVLFTTAAAFLAVVVTFTAFAVPLTAALAAIALAVPTIVVTILFDNISVTVCYF